MGANFEMVANSVRFLGTNNGNGDYANGDGAPVMAGGAGQEEDDIPF